MVYAEVLRERKSIAATLLVTMAILFTVLWFAAPAAVHSAASQTHVMTSEEMRFTEGAGPGKVLAWCAVGVGLGILAIGVITLAAPAVVGAAVVTGIFGSSVATALGTAAVSTVGWSMVGGGAIVTAGGAVGVAISD